MPVLCGTDVTGIENGFCKHPYQGKLVFDVTTRKVLEIVK